MKSYLSERTQCIEISKTCQRERKSFQSGYQQNNNGTPQGGILSPLLFLIYINDLPDAVQTKCLLFADDTTLIIKSDSHQNLQNEASKALDNAVSWLENNNLKINMSKTKIVQFQTFNANLATIEIKCRDSLISSTNECVFLGITMDQHCSWKPHIEKLVNKIDSYVYMLKRIRQTVNVETAMVTYHAYIASRLKYGIIIWGNSVEVNRVFKAQKRCVRAISGIDYLDSCRPLFVSLKILPLSCVYVYEICIYIKNNPSLFKKFSDIETSRSRHGEKLCLPLIRLELYKRNVYCMCIKIYNHLPNNLKIMPTTLFKKKLYNVLLNKTYYTIKDYLEDKNISNLV